MVAHKAFVLLSGGIDSTTCLAIAANSSVESVEGVSIDYGQRHKKEIDFARVQCTDHGATHHTLMVERLGGMLTSPEQQIPNVRYDQIEGVSPTYVPFRNGTLLSMITAHAQRWVNAAPERNASVYFGAHAEDAQNWAYPDCTPEFIGAMANAIYIGTYQTVRLCTPLMWFEKHAIVTLGAKLGVNFLKTWSCYAGGELHCGKCPTCFARQDAFRRAGIKDPTVYDAQ